jgi:hypothetical protein
MATRMDSQNAVPNGDVLRAHIIGSLSASSGPSGIRRDMLGRNGHVTSFSRSLSSTITSMRPARKSSTASRIEANGMA